MPGAFACRPFNNANQSLAAMKGSEHASGA
jgi:hypothetical protein